MARLSHQLQLPRCPHCSVAQPLIQSRFSQVFETAAYNGLGKRYWLVYACATCGGCILAGNEQGFDHFASEIYPAPVQVDDAIPDPAHSYLNQAVETIHAPAGSVMLAASAVDAMLKIKGYKDGSLYSRINKAAEDHLITKEMAEWAHEVRFDANEQRHADDSVALPTEADAKRSADFARALAEFLFVLPERVERGRQQPT